MAATQIDDLLRRHLELALRLYHSNRLLMATRVTLACLEHEPPSRDSEALCFLVNALLLQFADASGDAWDNYRTQLRQRPELRKTLAWWAQFWAESGEPGASEPDTDTERRLQRAVEFLEAVAADAPAGEHPDSASLPPGCARGVVVEQTGNARLVHVHVRFGQWRHFGQGRILGQPVPGAQSALDAAQQYLARAGCETVDDCQAEVLVEGLFGPVQGESLALPVFMAAVSAQLRMGLPADWAFTGAVGSASVNSPVEPIMPVNELQAKLDACGREGCLHLAAPAHVVPDRGPASLHGPCALEIMASTTQVVEHVLPEHRLIEAPQPASSRDCIQLLLKNIRPDGSSFHGSTHRVYALLVPLLFAVMLTERWLFGDYLIPEYYSGTTHPSSALARLLGVCAALILAAGLAATLRLPDQLLDHGLAASWSLIAVGLLGVHLLSWLLLQWLIRDPFASPPHGLFFEHRSLQWWKDVGALYLYALIYFVSPFTRIRLAERAAAAGRFRWAEQILDGRRWANASLPISSIPVLIVIAAITFVAFGYLDWRALVDPSRAGASPESGPWRTIHIIGRAQLYAFSCAAALWWIAASTQRIRGLSRSANPR